jgi:hypothetical protein
VLEAINAGCPVAISDQVYLADSFHAQSEVLPVRLDAWVEFLRERMPEEHHRRKLVELDRAFLIPQFSMDTITRNWAATINAVFAAGRIEGTPPQGTRPEATPPRATPSQATSPGATEEQHPIHAHSGT